MGIKRPDSRERSGARGSEPQVGALAVAYPTLWEWLSLTKYEDSSPRITSTLLLFVEDGCVKACLGDRDAQTSGWASGESLEACLEAMDSKLSSGTLDWRVKRPAPRAGKK